MKDDYIYGTRAIIEAVNAGKQVNKVLLNNKSKSVLNSELTPLLSMHNIPIQYVPVEKLNKISMDNHQGAVAFMAPIDYYDLEEIILEKQQANTPMLLLVLDRVTDVRNLGSIARSAECLGVDAIVIPTKEAAQVSADAVKTSAGALHSIKVCRTNNLRDTFLMLNQYEIQIVGCTEKSDIAINEIDLKLSSAIVMGSEENGISKELFKRCDVLAKIPMSGTIASMNVSVSCGIALYEAVSQRNA